MRETTALPISTQRADQAKAIIDKFDTPRNRAAMMQTASYHTDKATGYLREGSEFMARKHITAAMLYMNDDKQAYQGYCEKEHVMGYRWM
jgi:hypothetical protein